jgi:hypothetical protein
VSVLKISKSEYKLRHIHLSPRQSARLSVSMKHVHFHWKNFEETWYLSFFSKLYRENSSFITIWQESWIAYMKTFSHLWQYLDKFFLKLEMFQTQAVEKIKHTFYVKYIFSENHVFYETMSKNMVKPEVSQIRSQYGAYDLHAG